MFKKLKRKIEEGEEGAIDRLAFSPRRLPGSAVRSVPSTSELSETSDSAAPADGERAGITDYTELVDGDDVGISGDGIIDSNPVHVPNHLQSSVTPDAANALLIARIRDLEQERTQLTEHIDELERAHAEQREAWEEQSALRLAEKDKQQESQRAKLEKLEGEVVDLKLQIVELQLEKAELEQELKDEVGGLSQEVEEGRRTREEERREAEGKVKTLEEALNQKEKVLGGREERMEELEGKVQNLQSRLEAYSNSDDNEVIHRLQNEVIELERRVRARNIELEIMETRLASELGEKEADIQVRADREDALSTSCKELTEQVSEKTKENRRLFRELEQQTMAVERKEKEVTRLEEQLEQQNQMCQRLEKQLAEVGATDIGQLRLEKDEHIAELSRALEVARAQLAQLRPPVEGEGGVVNGVVGDGSSLDAPHRSREDSGPAVLPVTDYSASGGEATPQMNGELTTMQSHELGEELQCLRENQLSLEEELSEKSKIIKIQQQKIIDMRKALNKELKAQSSVDGSSSGGIGGVRNFSRDPTPPLALTRVAIASEVNFQYLKHVVIKFMCSREDEATQLIRAISTLLEFTSEEETHVKDYLQYKMSWFGSMPPPLYQPQARIRRQSK